MKRACDLQIVFRQWLIWDACVWSTSSRTDLHQGCESFRLPQVWMLVRGFVSSMRSLAYMGCVGTLVLYIFAVVTTEVVGRNAVFEEDEYVPPGRAGEAVCAFRARLLFISSILAC